MSFAKINPTQTQAWQKLQAHFEELKHTHMNALFADDAHRAKDMSIRWQDFFVDYSKNRITSKTLSLLSELAQEVDLKSGIDAYFGGEAINQTEGRAVLHTALRNPKTAEVLLDGKDMMPEILSVRAKMEDFSTAVLDNEKVGHTGKPFTDVVNIGIGGSDLGPAMVVEALKFYKTRLNMHFVSNVDGDHVMEVIRDLNPETTLFVIVSKTFTTQETLSNAQTIREWFLRTAPEHAVSHHFVAVSTNIEAVKAFGIDADNIFPMWDWVGGRFSLWSAVGLSIMLAIGKKDFGDLLRGAYEMDEHFRYQPFEENIPVVLALISIWYNNFFGAESEAIIPYTQYLHRFAAYMQQGIMESNGKSVDRNGQKIDYQTGTIIWGEPGTNSQHAFFQLIHQGTKLIPADFIGFTQSLHKKKDHHKKLMSNFIAQTEALMNGKDEATVVAELKKQQLNESEIADLKPFKIFEGNKPTNSILINKLTPSSLGALIALYEHKIFVQGYIWNIYSYDQWGVELGKQLANNILKDFDSETLQQHDASTLQLINIFKALN
jgi:glucose-6-phosphate isomerase